ncbi:MAG: Fic family protein [bacterium]
MTQEDFINHRLSKRLIFNFVDNNKVHNLLSQIDSINKEWQISTTLSPQFLEKLQTNTIVSSTGASTRIEGSKLSDEQVELFLRQSKLRKLETRDQQEVAGYLEMIKRVFEDFESIELQERTIKQAHSVLLKYSQKDDKYRGGYKLQSNQVVAVDDQGQVVGVIFNPSNVEETPMEMKDLINWTKEALENNLVHPLLVISNFVFEFLSIHPFKDGNGRISRILTNLLLLKNRYSFVKYISNEKLVEKSKVEYYLALRKTSNTWKTDKEDLTPWLFYFLDVLQKQGELALDLTRNEEVERLLSDKQLQVWKAILASETIGRKEIAEKTGLSLKTMESTTKKLMIMNKIERVGEGRASRYRVKNK